jgi:hypothetical protein
MNDFVRVLAISLLPAVGNILGALVAESVRAPPWIIGAALHGAVDSESGLHGRIHAVRGAVGVFGIGESPCDGTVDPFPTRCRSAFHASQNYSPTPPF